MAQPLDASGQTEFWLEAITGILLALLLFVFKQPQLGWITVIIAFFQALSRYKYSKQLDTELAPVKKMAEVLDLAADCDVNSIRTILDLYTKITEEDFRDVKESIASEAVAKLSGLALDKRSEILATGRYYHWLLPMIDTAASGSEIWAISMMLDCEWDDSPPERNFLEANLKAARRGVRVVRVFIVPRAHICGLSGVPPVAAQLAGDVTVLLAERERLARSDPDLLSLVGDGLIAFDRRVVLVDQHSVDGRARGFVTMNAGDISKWRGLFDNLLQHAEPMHDVLKAKCKPPEPHNLLGRAGAMASSHEVLSALDCEKNAQG